MNITLTDISGVRFDLDTAYIDEIRGGTRAEIILTTGETVHCQEGALTVMQLVIDSKFKGAGK